MASSSSSSVQPPQVFINFRGKELRKGFVSHLVAALKKDGINVYIDEDETRGKNINKIFFEKIEESKIALAIFSSQYTESSWCLDELVKIKERVDLNKLVVVPIFFKIAAEDVADLKGVFSDNFLELARTYENDDGSFERWRIALKEITENLGLVYNEIGEENEAKFIERVVGALKIVISDLLTNLEIETPIGSTLDAGDEETIPTFGIETRLEQLEEKLDFGCEPIRMIGVVGMPGIGKRTLAEKLFEKKKSEFVHHAILKDVRDLYRNGLVHRRILVKELLKIDYVDEEEVTNMHSKSSKKLLESKSLIFLANVSDKEQIKILLGECEWLREGSKILITTSDKSVVEGKVHDTYEVLRLDGKASLECFKYYALGDNTPNEAFNNLSKRFADYAKGNPLALMILGTELYGKDLREDNFLKLEQSPNMTIKQVLRTSYEELGPNQKNVFLDIACFFRSGDEYYVRCLVETCDTEPTGDGVGEIKDLTDKFLIYISGGRVEMHDLFYSFGKEVGLSGDKEAGLSGDKEVPPCRFWNKTAIPALRNRKGAVRVRAIFLDISELKTNETFHKNTFTKMRNLRYLKFYCSHCHRDCKPNHKILFPDGIDQFPMDEIRYLYWLKFPLAKLPNEFNPKNLFDLNLPYSEIIKVWDGVKDTPKLKWVDLSHSNKLSSLLGLQNAQSLQRLNLEGCTSLKELPKEMKRMKSLTFLNMRGCTSLERLPRISLISLETLILANCSKLHEFQVISENLKTLNLDGTAITQLPTNIGKLQRLIVLNLKDCKKLQRVPVWLGKLKALQELVLSGCSELKTFPIPIENMKCLQILLLDGTAITDMPKIFNSKDQQGGLKRGMNELSSLQLRRLSLSNNDTISNLQIDLCQLHHLKLLDLKYCKNLTSIPLLPPSLEILDAHGCEKLTTVASPMATLKIMDHVHSKFIFTNCNNLEQVAKNSITLYAQRKSQLDAVRCYKEENVLEALLITSFPGSEVPSWFSHRKSGPNLELDFPSHWCDNRLSTIVLCTVVTFPKTQDVINSFSIECTCEFKNKNERRISFNCILGGGWVEPRKIDSEHVFIGYTSSSHITNQLEESLQSGDQHKCVPTKASIKFEVRDGAGEIVNCGLSLVYEEPKHVVIEGGYNDSFSRRDGILSLAAGVFSGKLKFLWLVVIIFLIFGFGRLFYHTTSFLSLKL